jgi:hypothetical protein
MVMVSSRRCREGSHPALCSLGFNLGQGAVAFGFQDQMYPRPDLELYKKIRYIIMQLPIVQPGNGKTQPGIFDTRLDGRVCINIVGG